MAGVRRATYNDVTTIVEFLEHYHTNGSVLEDIPFSVKDMTGAVNFYLKMPKHVIFIYEDSASKLRGVLMGSVEPFMFNQRRSWATDLLFVSEVGGAWILKKFISWAKLYKVDRIMMGVSTRNERSDDLYHALGLEQMGGMYSLTIREDEKPS
jgi:hypothetical protein